MDDFKPNSLLCIRQRVQTLPKAQRTRGLSSYHKFKHKSNFIFRISTKHQLQNLNQTSASRLNLKFKILTKASFRISTKIQLHNLYKTSAEKNSSCKSCLNFNFKILTKPTIRISTKIQLHNLYKTSAEKNSSCKSCLNFNFKILTKPTALNKKFSFLTEPQLRNLQQIVANTILISNSYNINKF